MRKSEIAIIGAGISGLTAANCLHPDHNITVFEASSWIGGHTHTIDVPVDNGPDQAVDTGFIVFNDRTYPEFIKLLDRLNVESQPAPMTFSVRADAVNLEYRGADIGGLFAQKRNLLRPGFYRLLNGIRKFNQDGKRLIESGDSRLTVKEFFETHRYGREFYEYYFLPMGSAIWSCPQSTFESFPIRFIASFYHHHGLLGLNDRPQWRVIKGGSRNYVHKLIAPFEQRIHTNCPVEKIVRQDGGITIHSKQGVQRFDRVVFACHADQSLGLLGDQATSDEQTVLGAFPYEMNEVVLHSDSSILPKRRRAWASWNYLLPERQDSRASLTYCMNILQSLDTAETWCVTLNNTGRINPDKIHSTYWYSHPIFDCRREEMQGRHGEISGHHRSYYCGAYWGNGFHEDGVVSGLRVANQILSESLTAEPGRRTESREMASAE